MRELRKRLPPGSSPGTLAPIPGASPTSITLCAYNNDTYIEKSLDNVVDIPRYLAEYTVNWIHVSGFQDLALIEELGTLLNLHSLSLEDALYGHHRTKIEEYDHYLFIITQMVSITDKLHAEQISFFLLNNCLVTFHETTPDCLDPVRSRMKRAAGKIRGRGLDYLAYALLDTIIDNYYPALEHFNEALEQLENSVLSGFQQKQLIKIHSIKNDIQNMQRVVWPMREVIGVLMREESGFIKESTYKYLRDCYDHVVQLEELTEYCRELAGSLMELHLSFSNQKMSDVMKFLTLVSTFFIPLNFITSFYGMNFHDSPFNMPELGWRYGYIYAVLLLLCCACGMFYLFKRRGWIQELSDSKKNWEYRSEEE